MTRRLNVLQLISTLEIGGVGAVVSMISRNLDKKKFRSLICCINGEGPILKEIQDYNVEVRVLDLRRRSIIYFPLFVFDIICTIVALVKIMKKEKVDILHTHFPDHHIFGAICAKIAKVPVTICSFHNIKFLAKRGNWDVRTWLKKELLTLIVKKMEDRIIAVADGVRETIVKFFEIRTTKIATIYNGIDASTFAKAVDFISVRQQLNLSLGVKVVICIANFFFKKGHKVLIEAASTVVKNYSNVKFLFVGDGPLRNELVALVTLLDLNGHIDFLGFRRDIPEILGISDIFVLPSLWEGLPLALLEAMATGKAVVASNVLGNSEVVLPNKTGILTPPKDSDALAKAIIYLIEHPEIAQDMGRLARERVATHFSCYSTIRKTEELYITLAKEKMLLKMERNLYAKN